MDISIIIALDYVVTQQELIALLVLISKELHKGKVIWKEFFRTIIDNTVRKNVKFDKNIEERVQ